MGLLVFEELKLYLKRFSYTQRDFFILGMLQLGLESCKYTWRAVIIPRGLQLYLLIYPYMAEGKIGG